MINSNPTHSFKFLVKIIGYIYIKILQMIVFTTKSGAEVKISITDENAEAWMMLGDDGIDHLLEFLEDITKKEGMSS